MPLPCAALQRDCAANAKLPQLIVTGAALRRPCRSQPQGRAPRIALCHPRRSRRTPAVPSSSTARQDSSAAPLSFRDRQFLLREEAILDAANQLLAQRGFELMSMDDLAAMVGIAKGSLYKHFESKEQLAAASMTRLLRRIEAELAAQERTQPARARLEQLLRWTLRERAAGRMPLLPSTNQAVQQALMSNGKYTAALADVGNALAALVEDGAAAGELRGDLPVPVLLFTIYARSCDPSFDFLRASGEWSDDQVIDFMVATCFDGLATRPPARGPGDARK